MIPDRVAQTVMSRIRNRLRGGRKRRASGRVVWVALWLASCGGSSSGPPAAAPPASFPSAPAGLPNFVIILADDLGYGDMSANGPSRLKTPNLDQMAAEGVRLTGFDVPAAICAPSRAALMTGRYPVRTGIFWNPPVRLNPGEITIADALKARGYVTSMVGKWHLGWDREDMPTHHGFDFYYGMPAGEDPNYFMRQDQITTDGVGLEELAWRYTVEAADFIHSVRDRPFFLYLAHRSPHTPLYASYRFAGTSPAGILGDVVAELDWGVGEVIRALRETGHDRDTFVFFFSDNGPDLKQGPVESGSAGPFSGGKGSPQEGGLREPAIAWWPGRLPAGKVVSEPTVSMDLFPTLLALAGGTLPTDRNYDGQDIFKVLTGEVTKIPGPGVDGGRELLSWEGEAAVALRTGKWKYLGPGFWQLTPGFYDLEADPGERNDLSAAQPDLARRMKERLAADFLEVTRGK
jgi:arylsulfatase A